MENNAVVIEKPAEKTGTRRVGTITVGVSMVGFGVLFLLSSLFEAIGYETVFAMWPLILIVLGFEVLAATAFKGKLVYDKGSVFIMILMMFLAAGMAAVDVCLKVAENYLPYIL